MKHASRLAALAIILPLLSLLPIRGATQKAVAEGSNYGRQIMVANVDGTAHHTITTVGNNFSPDWSPDGSKIVMTSDRNGGWDIFVHDMESGSDTRITATQDGSHADWNPKANELVFSYNFGVLGKRNSNGTGSIRNLPGLDNIFFTQPVFSPNGRLIASYGETINGGPREVFVQNADGTGKPVALEGQSDGEKNWQPEWQSDTLLSYVSMRRDGTYLVTYNLETKETTVVKKVNGLGELSWNPSSGLAYSWYDTQRKLVSVGAADMQEARIFGLGEEPDWSADGSKLAYVVGTFPQESGWICPITFNGMISVTIKGTNTVTVTVQIFDAMENLSIMPSGQSNLEGQAYSWDNPVAGEYSGSWGVTNVLSPSIEFTVHNVWNNFPMDEWYRCERLQYHITLAGSEVEAVHLEGPDIDETITLTDGKGLRPWLREGIYLATPVIGGEEKAELRQRVELIGRDGTATWETQEAGDVTGPGSPPTGNPPVVQNLNRMAYLPIVQFAGTQ